MEIQKIKVAIRNIPESLNDQIFIYSWEGDHATYFTFREDGEVIANRLEIKVGEANTMKPAIICRNYLTRAIVEGFMKMGSKEMGIERPSESRATGMLEAQGRHLEDLRTMLKLK